MQDTTAFLSPQNVTHFAVICPPFSSHIRALEALCGELIERGHRVTWIHQPEVRALLQDERIGFAPVGANDYPAGSLARVLARAAQPGGLLGLRRVIADVSKATDMLCREGQPLLQRLGIDVVIADQMEAAGGLIADSCGLPFVSVACALPVNREPRVPLPVMPWGYAGDETALRRNEVSARVYDWLMTPHARVIRRHAIDFGLAPRDTLADCLSPLLQLSQTTEAFDLPRTQLPECFHHVGPLRPLATYPVKQVAWDLDLTAGRPLVFASLGTLQGHRLGLFKRMARACRSIDVQLLIAHCGGLAPDQATALKRIGNTWVTDFAPQRIVLSQANAAITHAGLNTVMDALAAGTPMLALPIAFDQPGIAERVTRAGVGLKLHPRLATQCAMERALLELLRDERFRTRASVLGRDVLAAGGTARAADLVERALGIRRDGVSMKPACRAARPTEAQLD